MIHLTETLNEEGGYTEQMQDLAKIFRLATNKSLVLIDEFGKSKLS
jgi:Mismatch repair ATPase (MutS family)